MEEGGASSGCGIARLELVSRTVRNMPYFITPTVSFFYDSAAGIVVSAIALLLCFRGATSPDIFIPHPPFLVLFDRLFVACFLGVLSGNISMFFPNLSSSSPLAPPHRFSRGSFLSPLNISRESPHRLFCDFPSGSFRRLSSSLFDAFRPLGVPCLPHPRVSMDSPLAGPMIFHAKASVFGPPGALSLLHRMIIVDFLFRLPRCIL